MLDEKIGVEREELKGKFIIVKSKSAYELYSDNSGNGIEGITNAGVGNETLCFEVLEKDIKIEEVYQLCDIIELIYIAIKLAVDVKYEIAGISSGFFVVEEGGEGIVLSRERINELLKIDKNIIIEKILQKIEEIKKLKKILFLQNRVEWNIDTYEIINEKIIRARRRLAINICNEEVKILC